MFYIRPLYRCHTTEEDYNAPFGVSEQRHAMRLGKLRHSGKGHMTFQMLSIKKRLLSHLFCTKY